MENVIEKNLKINNAFKEVLCVINHLVKEDYDKIPQNVIDYFEENQNKDYDFSYDETKPFKEQVLLEESKYLLFNLFEMYGATESQKAKIASYRKNYYARLEEEKKEKYNPNELFKSNDENEIKIVNEINIDSNNINTTNNLNISLPVEYKTDGIINKIINFIKKIFRK